jgi:DNA-binding NarL/FixJ family response regulator
MFRSIMAKILIADCQPIIRMGLKALIQNFIPHSTIEEACNVDSTLDKISKNEFKLIISRNRWLLP